MNQKFEIWCIKKCLSLWNPPHEVIDWLNNLDDGEKAQLASWTSGLAARDTTNVTKRLIASSIRWYAKGSILSAQNLIITTMKVLDTTEHELKIEFVSSLPYEDLSNTNSDWIDYLTVGIFSR